MRNTLLLENTNWVEGWKKKINPLFWSISCKVSQTEVFKDSTNLYKVTVSSSCVAANGIIQSLHLWFLFIFLYSLICLHSSNLSIPEEN